MIQELKTVTTRVLRNNNNNNNSNKNGSRSSNGQGSGTGFSSEERVKLKHARSGTRDCGSSLGRHTASDPEFEEQAEWIQEVSGGGIRGQENEPGWRIERSPIDARDCHSRGPSTGRSEGEAMAPAAPTSADVWSMLDTYFSRRSDVARANFHVKAVEAMRKVTGCTFNRVSGCRQILRV